MSEGAIATAGLLLSAAFAWMLARDYREGKAELPRTGWTVVRRYDPALFWTFTSVNGLLLAMLVFASMMLVLR